MKRNCSIRDVASHVGVSPSTVSRVLNNRMGNLHVSEQTRERILTGARALNYTPNIHARRLFSRRSGAIALVLPSWEKRGHHVFRDNHLVEIFSGIEQALTGTDNRLQVVFNDRYFADNKVWLSLFREQAIDGMLVWGSCASEEFWPALIAEDYPVVFLTKPAFGCDEINYVLHDYEASGRLAMEHLLALGHRRIGWIGGFHDSGSNSDIEAGLHAAAAGCPGVELHMVNSDFTPESGEAALEELRRRTPGISAVIAVNVISALAIVDKLRREGCRVPEELAVCACDYVDHELAGGVTRIQVDDRRLGRCGVSALLDLVSGKAGSVRELLPVTLLKGETT